MIRFNIFIIVFTVVLIISCNGNTTENRVINSSYDEKINFVINKELSLNNYSEIKGISKKEGLIPNEKMAFQIAEIVLSQIYGAEIINNEKPFSINLENEIWIIEGSLKDESKGGVAYIEISKQSGQILKVLHTE